MSERGNHEMNSFTRAAELPIPGLLLGAYPERRHARRADSPVLPAWVRLLGDGIGALEVGGSGRFVAQVRACEQTLQGQGEEQVGSALRALRLALGRDGFRSEHVARAFALVGATSSRVLRVRPFDTQLIAGRIVLDNRLAEMATGEGKTLAVALAAATAALAGIPVHVITANDYLVTRDAEQLAPLYRALGLVGRRRDAAAGRRAGGAWRMPATSPTAPPRNWSSTTCAMASTAPAIRCAGASSSSRAKASRRPRAARPVHGDHRRGRQHSDRRGARAADPVASGGRRPATRVSRAVARPRARDARRRGLQARRDRALQRSSPTRGASGSNTMRHRCRRCGATACIARKRSSTRACGAAPVPARPPLSGARRQGPDHRRDHRPRCPRPRVVARPAPADRAQGRLRAERGASHRGPDHLPALLSALPAPGRHERHAPRGARRTARRIPALPCGACRCASRAGASCCRGACSPTRASLWDAVAARVARVARARDGRSSSGHGLGRGFRSAGAAARRGRRCRTRAQCAARPGRSRHRGAGRRARRASRSRPTWPVAAPTSACATASRSWAACTSSAASSTPSRRIDRQFAGRCARQGDPGSVETWLSLDAPLAGPSPATPPDAAAAPRAAAGCPECC